jgi:DUF3017 family protein
MTDPADPGRRSRPLPQTDHSIAPRKPRTVGGLVYLGLLLATALGLGLVVLGHWRTGLTVMGVAMLCGGAARLVVPNAQAGMLGIRRRLVDVLTLTGLGLALTVLAAVIPARFG